MYIDGQTIVAAAAVLVALFTLIGYYNKGYSWVKKQDKQELDIASIKKEQTLLTYGVLACLKGLKEQGCNGPVNEAIKEIEKHLNKKAHEQEE